MKVIKFPELHGETGAETLLNFYYDIGWDGETKLLPTKIEIHEKKWKLLCDKMETHAVKLSYLDKGPSQGRNVPKEKVHIYKGAF